MRNKKRLSVCIITYNHKKYIVQAIESVLRQKTNFNWELVIADDFSTDGTRNILLEYKKKYPEKIKLILQKKNVGASKNFLKLITFPDTKYIAYFEGDDYWTSPNKLQIQFDFLEENERIIGCFHDVVNVDENDKIIKKNYFNSPQKYYNQKDCITTLQSSYATCSIMFRQLCLKKLPYWFKESPTDFFLDLLITEFGYLCYLDKNLGAYRIHKQGAWQGSSLLKNNKATISRYNILYKEKAFKLKYKNIIWDKTLHKMVENYHLSPSFYSKTESVLMITSYLNYFSPRTYMFLAQFIRQLICSKKKMLQ